MAFNFYAIGAERGDAIVAGISKAGKVWTDVKALGPRQASRLAAALDAHGITLATNKTWSVWQRAGRPFMLDDSQTVDVAVAIAQGIAAPR
jgi:hypothetical protein